MWRWLRELLAVYPLSHVHRAVEFRWQAEGAWGEACRPVLWCTVCQREVC